MGALVGIAACLLLGQAAPPASAGAPAAGFAAPTSGTATSPAGPTSRGATPGRSAEAAPAATAPAAPTDDVALAVAESTALAAELFQPTAASDASVRAVKLADLVAAARGSRDQTSAVQAYWKLSAAAAKLSATARELEKLEQLADAAGRRPDAQAAAALGAAMNRASQERADADSQLIDARREVARRLNLDARTTPVAVDAPHAGVYHTRLANVYSGAAPPQAVILHRSIQLRGEAVFAHAAATKACSRMADAELAAFAEGRVAWQTALAGVAEQGRRRRAFIDAVYAYNRDIAEYALPIAKSDLPTATLVGMLIKTETATAARPSAAKSASRSEAAAPGEAHSSAAGARR